MITVTVAFPTTVSSIIQFGDSLVFLDITIPAYNIDITKLEDVIILPEETENSVPS